MGVGCRVCEGGGRINFLRGMRSEKRSLAINEMKEALKSEKEETDETEINTLAEPILLSLEVEEK